MTELVWSPCLTRIFISSPGLVLRVSRMELLDFRSSLRDSGESGRATPALKCRAIFGLSRRDERQALDKEITCAMIELLRRNGEAAGNLIPNDRAQEPKPRAVR